MVGLDHEQNGFQYTGRSLSLISVLGGILVILVIIAFISCYKHRKRVRHVDIVALFALAHCGAFPQIDVGALFLCQLFCLCSCDSCLLALFL